MTSNGPLDICSKNLRRRSHETVMLFSYTRPKSHVTETQEPLFDPLWGLQRWTCVKRSKDCICKMNFERLLLQLLLSSLVALTDLGS